jgi:hypothetical protein
MPEKKEYQSDAHRFLRPAFFCAELMHGGFSFDRITISYLGSFKKSYRAEIERVVCNKNQDHFELGVSVNSDGLYDHLPEGLFHQAKGNSKTIRVLDMVEEFRRSRDEEKQARKFFQPFEQEFFRCLCQLQYEEQDLAFEMLDGSLKEELLKFWQVPTGLPGTATRVMMQIMPWMRHMKGNLYLTARALEYILGKRVRAREYCREEYEAEGKNARLGHSGLGTDTVLGASFEEASACWIFTIEDIAKNTIGSFRPQESFGKLLYYFEEIFIPLSIDAIFECTVAEEATQEAEDVLGYSLIL